MMGATVRRFGEIVRMDLSGAELLLGFLSLAWGLVLVADADVFRLATYVGFVRLGLRAHAVGGVLSCVGGGLLVALGVGRRAWRRPALLAAVAVWGFMAGVLMLAPVLGASPWLAAVHAAGAFLAFLALRVRDIPHPSHA